MFDRDSAAVRVDPATGRGVITYTGVWAGDGQRYAVTMCTPPPAAARPAAAPAAAARAPGQVPAADNSVMALTVAAVRLRPGAQRSGTGSFASLASGDDILGGPEAALPLPGGLVGAAGSAASVDGDDGDAGAAVVGEGLRRFFSSLMLNLQVSTGWAGVVEGGCKDWYRGGGKRKRGCVGLMCQVRSGGLRRSRR